MLSIFKTPVTAHNLRSGKKMSLTLCKAGENMSLPNEGKRFCSTFLEIFFFFLSEFKKFIQMSERILGSGNKINCRAEG